MSEEAKMAKAKLQSVIDDNLSGPMSEAAKKVVNAFGETL